MNRWDFHYVLGRLLDTEQISTGLSATHSVTGGSATGAVCVEASV